MRDPRALQDWANLDDFGLQLPPDLVPTMDPLTELGIFLKAELSGSSAPATVKAEANREESIHEVIKTDTAA